MQEIVTRKQAIELGLKTYFKQIDLTISRTGKKKSDVIREALVHGLEKVEGKQPL